MTYVEAMDDGIQCCVASFEQEPALLGYAYGLAYFCYQTQNGVAFLYVRIFVFVCFPVFGGQYHVVAVAVFLYYIIAAVGYDMVHVSGVVEVGLFDGDNGGVGKFIVSLNLLFRGARERAGYEYAVVGGSDVRQHITLFRLGVGAGEAVDHARAELKKQRQATLFKIVYYAGCGGQVVGYGAVAHECLHAMGFGFNDAFGHIRWCCGAQHVGVDEAHIFTAFDMAHAFFHP